jgi:hypothetical protein
MINLEGDNRKIIGTRQQNLGLLNEVHFCPAVFVQPFQCSVKLT